MSNQKEQPAEHNFVKKVWIVGLIFSLIAITLFIIEATFDILILVLAGALIACYFRGISSFIQQKLHWGSKVSLSISVVGTVLIFSGILFLIGATVSQQAVALKEALPEMLESAQKYIHKSDLGREIMEQIKDVKSPKEFSQVASKFFKTTFSGITNMYVILLVGIFFTVAPTLYVNGVVSLVRPKNKPKAKTLMDQLGSSLVKWLIGKFIAMFAVFVLTAIGLIILDVPMWLTLSILAGLLNFIPNFGPLMSAVPAILVGLSENLTLALLIAGLYLVVQLFESSFITPKAQQKLIQIPPALIILAQVFMGVLAGILGVIFATPLILILMILVQELYTKPMNEGANQLAAETDEDQ